jgi:hypothetical protein
LIFDIESLLPVIRRIEALAIGQRALSRDETHLDPDTVGIFARDIITTSRPRPFLGRADDMSDHYQRSILNQ